jgi:hypothetical protein
VVDAVTIVIMLREKIMKVIHVRITNWDFEMLSKGGQVDRVIDGVFLKIYRQ